MARQILLDSPGNSPGQSRTPPQIPLENRPEASRKGRRRCKSPAPQTTEGKSSEKETASPPATPEQLLRQRRESPHEISVLVFDRNSATPSPLRAGPQDVGSSPTVRSRRRRFRPLRTSPVAASKSSSNTWRCSR